MIIDDIEGSKPLAKKEYEFRDTLNCFDIKGAQARKGYIRGNNGGYDSLSYTDVTKKAWQSRRSTNPLNPTYTVWDQSLGEFGKKVESQ